MAVTLRQSPAHDALINLHAECMRDLCGNALIAESGVTTLAIDLLYPANKPNDEKDDQNGSDDAAYVHGYLR